MLGRQMVAFVILEHNSVMSIAIFGAWMLTLTSLNSVVNHVELDKLTP